VHGRCPRRSRQCCKRGPIYADGSWVDWVEQALQGNQVQFTALLALADGNLFWGKSIGGQGYTVGEIVFNTAMTGYQEILTDPSYYRQIITFTYPHVGNVGVNDEDVESPQVYASGVVIRDLPSLHSNWRAEGGLQAYLQSRGVIGIADVDTRYLTQVLREQGAQSGCIMAGENLDEAQAVAAARAFPGLEGADLARDVSTAEAYSWTQGVWPLDQHATPPRVEAELQRPWHVVAYDFGVKRNILRMLVSLGARVTVVPAETAAHGVLALAPDGVFLSNGPGDPAPCSYALTAIRALLDAGVPMFGICLGHQLLALAAGARTVKMKFGHHGANHPVKDVITGSVLITSQNHGFAVDEETLPANVRATHRSLFDGSLQGIHLTDQPAFGFQGHPEASPGPHDLRVLFKHFFELMASRRAPSSISPVVAT
jgi:carbamoyl-phosphate synthase small subunit